MVFQVIREIKSPAFLNPCTSRLLKKKKDDKERKESGEGGEERKEGRKAEEKNKKRERKGWREEGEKFFESLLGQSASLDIPSQKH